MTVWVPGKLVNPLNGSQGGHWGKHATIRRRVKDHVCALIFAASPGSRPWVDALVPKDVTFTAYVWNEFDDDNIRAACKPHRDALVAMCLINDDRPSAGHTFHYAQIVSRGKHAKRGLEITVHPRAIPAEEGGG